MWRRTTTTRWWRLQQTKSLSVYIANFIHLVVGYYHNYVFTAYLCTVLCRCWREESCSWSHTFRSSFLRYHLQHWKYVLIQLILHQGSVEDDLKEGIDFRVKRHGWPMFQYSEVTWYHVPPPPVNSDHHWNSELFWMTVTVSNWILSMKFWYLCH